MLISLTVAQLVSRESIAQGLMFVNQTAASAILVIALSQGATGGERLFDALIGGGVALVISLLLFPAPPLPIIHDAIRAVLTGLQDVVERTEDLAVSRVVRDPRWTLAAGERMDQQLVNLVQACTTAREIVRAAPLRWPIRTVIDHEDQRAAQPHVLASAVLSLARVTTEAVSAGDVVPVGLHDALHQLAAALEALAPGGHAGATEAAAKAAATVRLAEQVSSPAVSYAPLIASLPRASARDLNRVACPAHDGGDRR